MSQEKIKFEWNNYKGEMHFDFKKRIVEFTSSPTIEETIDKIQKEHPNIYVFYHQDDYTQCEGYIENIKQICASDDADIRLELNHYVYYRTFLVYSF
jgi:hypothetical protein